MDYQEKTNHLYLQQSKNWPLFLANINGLENALQKSFQFDGFQINVQYNPKRIISSAAKIDSKTIRKRKCFLCTVNRPEEQTEVKFGNDYVILCNPFPIFKEHFTIAHINHSPQQINNSFNRFLDLSQALPNLLTFYNAPNCGASAPDHLHFQAGNLGFVPIEKDFELLKSLFGKNIYKNSLTSVTAINDTLRRFLVIESNNKESIENIFSEIYKYTLKLVRNDDPWLNIVSWYKNEWRIIIFLREKHRPWQYFEENEKNILLSPASVDLCGTLITPLEKDFNKITKKDISDILNQVSLDPEKFETLCNHLIKTLQ